MSAAGKVCIGFSKPYVAVYTNSGTTITYSDGRVLARGVDVSIEPETSDDNKFYADNTEAETDAGTFSGGTLSLTVDGLHQDAEALIMGLPAADSSGTSGSRFEWMDLLRRFADGAVRGRRIHRQVHVRRRNYIRPDGHPEGRF